MKRYLFFLCLACFFVQDSFSQSKEIADAVKRINSIKSDSKYLYAESTTKDWNQAYEDAKALLLVEIDNWVKSQNKKNDDVKGYVARIENNFMEVKTRRGNLFRVFVYIKKKNIMTYNEDVEVTVNSLNNSGQYSPFNNELESKVEEVKDVLDELAQVKSEAPRESKDSVVKQVTVEVQESLYVLNADEEKLLALKETSKLQDYLKENAAKFGKMSQMPKQQDCYVILFTEDKVEMHFKHIVDKKKDLNLESLALENLDKYQGLGYRGVWFIMK